MRTSIRIFLIALQAKRAPAAIDRDVIAPAVGERVAAATSTETQHNRLVARIAVVALGGFLMVLVPIDNAGYLAGAELAPANAGATALFNESSKGLGNAFNPGRFIAVLARQFYEINWGLPIAFNGRAHSAIAASFDTSDHDIRVAEAGIAALEYQ